MPQKVCYPFKGELVHLAIVLKYYRDKGIEIGRAQLNNVIKETVDDIGRENITEEVFLDIIKQTLSKKALSTVSSDFKAACINEFGQEFWDNLLTRKEVISENKKFRKSMQVTTIGQNDIEDRYVIVEERIIGKEENALLLKKLQEKNSKGNQGR